MKHNPDEGPCLKCGAGCVHKTGICQICRLKDDNQLLRLEIKNLTTKINTFYNKITHGDVSHRTWLRETFTEHFKK